MSTPAGTPTPRTDHAFHGSHLQSGFVHGFARQLERELAELGAAYEAAERTVEQWEAQFNKNEARNIELEQKLAAAQAEIAVLREDAERYQRIKRDHEIPWNIDVPDTVAGRFYVMYGGNPVGCLEGELDAAIDAARKP